MPPLYLSLESPMRSWRSAHMRIATVTALLAVSVMSSGAKVQDKAPPEVWRPQVSLSQTYTAEEPAAMAEETRQKAEAKERARVRKMRRISKDICTGC